MQPLQPPDFFGCRCENLHFQDRDYFKIDQTFFLNLAFLALSGFMSYLGFFERMDVKQLKEMTPKANCWRIY